MYGEKALTQRIELLKNRTNDDPFIQELVNLVNQLNEVQDNNILKTLEMRQDDSPFIAEIAELDIEKIGLEMRIVSMNGVNAMQLSQISIPLINPINTSNTIRFILLAFLGSFLISIVLALFIGAIKRD